MIVSASYRTDIPAFYGEWFRRRLAAGWAEVRNPYGGKPYRVDLAAAEAFVFWTRNVAPFLDVLEGLAGRKPFAVQMTVTGYPRALEPSVVAPEEGVRQVRGLARRYGPKSVVWRYDPVLLTSLTPPAWHRERFAELAAALEGAVDEVVLSVATVYAKTRANTEAAARRHGFSWWDPGEAEKRGLLSDLGRAAVQHGMTPRVCAQSDLQAPPLEGARCIDAARLSAAWGLPVGGSEKGNRPGCLCHESRDLGAYDTCPHGCTYCYAVRSPALAKRRFKAHDPAAISLG